MADIGRVGIIGGAGWLGGAIAKALTGSNAVAEGSLICSYRSQKPHDETGCVWTQDNSELVEASDVVILSVRPADWKSIHIDAANKLVISVMAGVTVENIKSRTGASRVARALPNAAAEVGCSYTPYFLDTKDASDHLIVDAIFGGCGLVDAVSVEDHIDYFTAMSGSGAAFPALLAEAMMNDAVTHGVSSDVARRAAQQLIIGAGRLQERHNLPPAETVKAFVDYNGTTAAGIIGMRDAGFESAVHNGLEAAYKKALELSKA